MFMSFFCASLLFYLLPSIAAFWRHRPNSLAILVLNVFLGWTFIGWVVALIWAVSTPREVMVHTRGESATST